MNICRLCSHEISLSPIRDGELAFCCAGCHAVYNILAAKNQLENFSQQLVFQQALKSGLISNPHLLEQLSIKSDQNGESEKLHLEIDDMWCPSCAVVIRLILLQEKGIRACTVDYTTDLAAIEFSPRSLSKDQIIERIRALGYRSHPLNDGVQQHVRRSLSLRFIIASFCALNVMMFAYPLYASYFHPDEKVGALLAWISGAFSLPVVSYCAWPIFRRFWNGMRVGIWGMETLVIIGVAAAFGLSVVELFRGGTRVYFDSMTVVIAFVLLGRIIETKAKFSAKESLLRLARSLPRRGRKRFEGGTSAFVPMKEIALGDIIEVRPGEKIILDGVVIEGEGFCNESLMTGEALPVEKKTRSSVLGGTLLLQGWLAYRVVATLERSALQRIVASVEQEIGTKSLHIRAVDNIVRWFVPLVLGVALATGFVLYFLDGTETAVMRAVAVLLISCPCAIGIAAPLAEAHLMNRLAEIGVIVRNRGCLAYLGKENLIAFDKTGTITQGTFTLLRGLEGLSNDQKAILKSMALRSNHPVAVAIAKEISCEALPLDYVEEVIGKGMQARHGKNFYQLGSESFLGTDGPALEMMTTHVFFAIDRKIVSELVFGDSLREGIKDLLLQLKPAKNVLLSGDSGQPVAHVAKSCGFENWHACLNPLQKREFILEQRAQGHLVCMVGDGINDAPALTAAHVGISVVSAADISIHVSDLLLTTDRLHILPHMRQLALMGQRIVRQNLFWAFFYNVIGIGLAMFGLLSPLFAAGAMVASSLIVTLNAGRLKNYQSKITFPASPEIKAAKAFSNSSAGK